MKAILPILLSFFVLTSCADILNFNETFDRGKGTEESPYWIYEIDQLQVISEPEYLDKHFIQIRNIDASKSAEFQNGSGFKRIGDIENPFTGSYNGNGFVIRDLHIHYNKFDKHNGLFGYTKNARLQNITIDNSEQLNTKSVNSETAYKTSQLTDSHTVEDPVDLSETTGVGGLAGVNDGGIVQNCHFTGVISGHIGQSVAGLVGINNGNIKNSSFEGKVTGGGASGLVDLNLGEIYNSHADASLSAMTAYGLVRMNEGLIFESSTSVKFLGTNADAGLVGFNKNNGRIESSFVKGTFDGHLLIEFGMVIRNSGEIVNSYSHVLINIEFYHDPLNPQSYGGLVLKNEPTGVIETSYAAGSLIIEPSDNIILTGAVAAENFGEIRSAYWDRDVIDLEHSVGEGSDEGTIGLTTSQMSGPSAQQNMPEFDWQNVWATTPDGYPILRWQEED